MKYVGLADEALSTGGAGLTAAQPQVQQSQVQQSQVQQSQAYDGPRGSESGTRGRIARLILENGPVTAAGLSARLGLTPAAVRRHLDNLLADGMVEARTARTYGSRGRGRPARLFAITDAGRSAFEHAYDDLATSALRFLAERAGPGAVAEFARQQIAELERRYRPAVEAAAPDERVQALAAALSADGYAASAGRGPVLADAVPRDWRWRGRTALPAPLPGGPRGRRVSRSFARRRPRHSAACSAPPCSASPRSPTATGSAPRTSHRQSLVHNRATTEAGGISA